MVSNAIESYGYQHLSQNDHGLDAQPMPAELTRADEVMVWFCCRMERQRRLVWARAEGTAWWKLAQRYRKLKNIHCVGGSTPQPIGLLLRSGKKNKK